MTLLEHVTVSTGIDALTPPSESLVTLAIDGNPIDTILVDGKHYRPHPNGGGLVAVTAFVGSAVFVDKQAMIKDTAIVLGHVHVRDNAVVEGEARVADRCRLAHSSRVGGFATLAGHVSLQNHARVGGTARLEGHVRLDHHACVTRGFLTGRMLIE